MVIQTDFADGGHLGMAGELAQADEAILGGLGGVVRMHTYGGVEEWILPGQPHARFQIGRSAAGAYGQHALHARRSGAFHHLVAVGIEFGIVQVDVRIHQPHLRRAPAGTSSWKPASTGLPPSTEAATIMPFDSMPRSLRGCKLATITTLRLTRSSGA